jgi:hypothetical protein
MNDTFTVAIVDLTFTALDSLALVALSSPPHSAQWHGCRHRTRMLQRTAIVRNVISTSDEVIALGARNSIKQTDINRSHNININKPVAALTIQYVGTCFETNNTREVFLPDRPT